MSQLVREVPVEQQLAKSNRTVVLYIAACIGLSYGLIEVLRFVLTALERFKTTATSELVTSVLTVIQYGTAAFGTSLALAAIFTLVEIQSTGRKRLVSTYAVSFSKLFLSFALFAIVLVVFERLIAPNGYRPLFDFQQNEHSVALTYIVVFAYIFVSDVLLYWVHRWEHVNKMLWYLHAIHHAEEDLDSASSAFHPVSNVIRWLLATLPLKFLVGINFSDALVLASFLSAVHFFQHTRAPFHFGWFGQVVGDNRFHFIHHSMDPKYYNKNFAAIFPVIDMMFGTYVRPTADHLPETGLPDRKGARDVWTFLTGRLER